MAFAGLSIVGWVFNWICWKKSFCCFKVYHNPIIQRVFWWFSFSFLCGLIAAAISGIVTTFRFGKMVRSVQCSYERVYYDLKNGQLKDSLPRWEGLDNITKKVQNSIDIIKKTNDFLIYDGEWDYMGGDYILTGMYPTYFINITKNIIDNCRIRREKSLKCNFEKISDTSTEVGKFLYEVDKKMTNINNKAQNLNNILKGFTEYSTEYQTELGKAEKSFTEISEDLKTYKDNFLNKIEHYVNVAKGCGYYLNMTYLFLICGISVFGIILLMGYTYIIDQSKISIIMHVVWNLIKFFGFSYFMYGAAYGMLFMGSRDAIGYNMYLFGDNLNKNTKTYLLPNKTSKDFLYFCLNKEKAIFKAGMDNSLSKLNQFYTSYNNLLSELKNAQDFGNPNIRLGLRRLDSTESELKEENIDSIDFSTDEFNVANLMDTALLEFNNMINNLNNKITTLKEINANSGDSNSNQLEILNGEFLDSFDCGFLKNDVSMIYNTLYDLSIECRILCAISCCIAFFGEIVVNSYLLTMFHYNNKEFGEKRGRSGSGSKKKPPKQNVEVSSRNQFLDKSKPINMKKYNQKLDLDFD